MLAPNHFWTSNLMFSVPANANTARCRCQTAILHVLWYCMLHSSHSGFDGSYSNSVHLPCTNAFFSIARGSLTLPREAYRKLRPLVGFVFQ